MKPISKRASVEEELLKYKQELELCRRQAETAKKDAFSEFVETTAKMIERPAENLKQWFIKYLSEEPVDDKIMKLAIAFNTLHLRLVKIYGGEKIPKEMLKWPEDKE